MLTPSSQITIITTVPTTECSKTLPARKPSGKSSAVDVCGKSALSAGGGLNERPSDLSANLSRCHQLKLQPKSNSKPSLLTEHRHGSDVTVRQETLWNPVPPSPSRRKWHRWKLYTEYLGIEPLLYQGIDCMTSRATFYFTWIMFEALHSYFIFCQLFVLIGEFLSCEIL